MERGDLILLLVNLGLVAAILGALLIPRPLAPQQVVVSITRADILTAKEASDITGGNITKEALLIEIATLPGFDWKVAMILNKDDVNAKLRQMGITDRFLAADLTLDMEQTLRRCSYMFESVGHKVYTMSLPKKIGICPWANFPEEVDNPSFCEYSLGWSLVKGRPVWICKPIVPPTCDLVFDGSDFASACEQQWKRGPEYDEEDLWVSKSCTSVFGLIEASRWYYCFRGDYRGILGKLTGPRYDFMAKINLREGVMGRITDSLEFNTEKQKVLTLTFKGAPVAYLTWEGVMWRGVECPSPAVERVAGFWDKYELAWRIVGLTPWEDYITYTKLGGTWDTLWPGCVDTTGAVGQKMAEMWNVHANATMAPVAFKAADGTRAVVRGDMAFIEWPKEQPGLGEVSRFLLIVDAAWAGIVRPVGMPEILGERCGDIGLGAPGSITFAVKNVGGIRAKFVAELRDCTPGISPVYVPDIPALEPGNTSDALTIYLTYTGPMVPELSWECTLAVYDPDDPIATLVTKKITGCKYIGKACTEGDERCKVEEGFGSERAKCVGGMWSWEVLSPCPEDMVCRKVKIDELHRAECVRVVCDRDGICEPGLGETWENCPSDCPKPVFPWELVLLGVGLGGAAAGVVIYRVRVRRGAA